MVTDQDFGNYQLGKISGTKFNDLDGDGTWDAGEPGLSGWTITLSGTDEITGTPVTLTTVTDADGDYYFTGLTKGTYTIAETMQAGWTETLPGKSTIGSVTYTVVIGSSGTVVSGRDFGNHRNNYIVIAVDKSPTTPQTVQVIDGDTGDVLREFVPYESSFTGGIRVATGDMDGDGIDEIITAPGRGRAPEVRVFTQAGVELTAYRTMAYATSMVNGVQLAVGDVNGDGRNDIVTIPTSGTAEVKVFLNQTGDPDPIQDVPYRSFLAFPASQISGGVVAVSDMGKLVGGSFVNVLDGKAEIVVGSGAGMPSVLEVFDVTGSPILVENVVPFNSSMMGGLSLSVARINSDLIPDIVIGAGTGGGSAVEVWAWNTASATLQNLGGFTAFSGSSINAPVRVAAQDTEPDGIADTIFAVQGPDGATNQIAVFEIVSTAPLQVQAEPPLSGFPGPWYIAPLPNSISAAPLKGKKTLTGGNTSVPQTFSITGPLSGTYNVGDAVTVAFASGGVVPGAKISLCFDVDGVFNKNEQWIEIDQVTAIGGAQSYQWNTSGIKPGTYYLAGYMYDGANTFTTSHASQAITIQGKNQSFALTGPTSGSYYAGDTVTIQWTAGNVVPGSKISLCFDSDTTFNNNEKWIEIDQVAAANGSGSFQWNTTSVKPGTYYLAGYMFDGGNTFTTSHLNQAITIQGAKPKGIGSTGQTFTLTAPTSGNYQQGEIVNIQWTAGNVVPGSKISLCFDSDTVFNNNEQWIEIDQVAAASGAASFAWNTSQVKPGTYYVAGYMYDGAGTFTTSHLTQSIKIQAATPTFSITGPTSGTYHAGDAISIQWAAGNVGSGSKISLCYDADKIWWNGNETWIEIDQVTAFNGNDTYTWNTTGVTPGNYYLAGYLWSGGKPYFSHLNQAVTITAAQPLMLDGPRSGVAAAVISDAQLAPIVAEAKRRWAAIDGDRVFAALADVDVQLADLADGVLGEAGDKTIRIDRDAAGAGWFVDPTPQYDEEFVARSNTSLSATGDLTAALRADLLTAVMHEMGHVLGHDHSAAVELMFASLSVGTRRTVQSR